MMISITQQLLVAAVGCTAERAALFAQHLNEACATYGITHTPARLSAFLAQVGHESGSLRYTSELWGPTPAQQRYEGRADLGNTQPGDGERYRGHGLIQTTGRFNHRAVRDRLRARGHDAPDFEAAPHLLAEPKWAAWSAADYWDWRGLNALADAGSFEAITVKINGGLNGQADRLERWAKAKAAIANAAAQPEPSTPEPPSPPIQPADIYGQEHSMPIPIAGIAAALLPSLIESIPTLGKLFGSGSAVSDRNLAAAGAVLDIVQTATKTVNAQAAVEAIKTDPQARAVATKAVEAQWFELVEGGGGGIDGARKADAAAVALGGAWHHIFRSPSFWWALLMTPPVWAVIGSVVGLWGTAWPADVRAAIATAVVSLVVGGGAGYYWGQSTSRNRSA